MPTYQYRCTNCDDELEVVQKFTDPALIECPSCDGELRKVYNAVGIVFKGSGFYATDHRTKGKSNAASGDAKPKVGADTSEKSDTASRTTTPTTGSSSPAKVAAD